jgi:hypothetical protein
MPGGAGRAHSEVMSLNTAVDVLLIGAAVVWVLVRQIRLARVKPRLLVLAPLVLAYFGMSPRWPAPAATRPSRPGARHLGAWRGVTCTRGGTSGSRRGGRNGGSGGPGAIGVSRRAGRE